MSTLRNLMLIVAAVFLSSSAYAATVQKIIKKRGIVIIDSDGDISKGDRYCFHNTKNKRVACGRVVRIRGAKAYVKVSKKRVRRIKNGYEAKPRDTQIAKSNVADFKMKDSNEPGSGHNIKVFYSVGLLSQSSYDPPTYTPELFSTGRVWDKPSPEKQTTPASFIGGGGEFEYVLNPSMSISLGGRFKIMQPSNLTANREITRTPEFVETNIEGTGVGGWADFYFYTLKMGGSAVKFGAGVDLDMVSITIDSRLKNDPTDHNGNPIDPVDIPIMEGTASTISMSIRVPIDFSYYFGNFGVGARAILMYSAVAFGSSSESTYLEGATAPSGITSPVENIVGQYNESVDIRNTGLAVELLPLTVIYQF